MGAGPPVLGPGYNLPGAEYFALAPNRSIALGPRLLIGNQTAPITDVPAGGNGTQIQSGVLDPNFTYSAGIYIVRAYGLFVPNDASSELAITGVRMGVGTLPNNILLDIGTPVSIFAAPQFAQIAVFERDLLITALDLPNFPFGSGLFAILQIGAHNNDATNPHNFQFGFTFNFHKVSGFVQ